MQNESLPSIALEFREGSSDKVYRAAVEALDGGHVVNFAYGRRGSALNTGMKTPLPVSLAEALDVYDKLVRSKTAKGYKPVAGFGPGVGTSVPGPVRADTGLRAQLPNPINAAEAEEFLADEAWCAQEKFDGKRLLVRKSAAGIVAANREGLVAALPDAVCAALSEIPGAFVLDGECVGETLHAFDLLEDGAADLRPQPYALRLGVLRARFGHLHGSVRLAATSTGPAKRRLLADLKANGREGIVFKDLRAPWSAGRPASGGGSLKLKFWESCSCVVSAVNARRSVEVALDGTPVGNVTVPPNHPVPAVGLVVEVRYLYVSGPGGSLYQPVYLGVRDDVPASDCTFVKQRLKLKPQESCEARAA